MTRLQKKCLIAAAGTHLLVVVAVLCSGFVMSKPKVDETQLLDVIPSTAIDALLNSGEKNPTPPAPQPVVQPQPQPQVQPQPQPELPKPIVTPPEKTEPVAPPIKIQPDDLTPVKIPDKPVKRHEIKPDFTPVKRADTDDAAAKKALADAQRKRDQQAKAFAKAMAAISKNSSSTTEVSMPNNSSTLSANYASIVRSIYYQAWRPSTAAAQNEIVKVSVTITSDGSVIRSHIVEKSGDRDLDASVQATLDRVNFIAPFLEGMTEKEWTRTISFSPETKNSE